MNGDEIDGGGARPARRPLGMPGRPRPGERLPSAYPGEEPQSPQEPGDGERGPESWDGSGEPQWPAPPEAAGAGGPWPDPDPDPYDEPEPLLPDPAPLPLPDPGPLPAPEPIPAPVPLPAAELPAEPLPPRPAAPTGPGAATGAVAGEPGEPEDAGEPEAAEEEAEDPLAAVPLKAALEAVLMVVDEPATEAHLASVLERPRREVAAALRELSAEYTAAGRGFDLRLVAGGWRFYSRAECAPAVDRFVLDGQQARLTQAALETLAVVAYRQPVSRSRVSAVRGVNCDGVMRTLVQRGLVEETGTEPETGAILYRTTNYFLERMGLRGLDELPELAPFLPEVDDVEAESLEGSVIAEAVAAARDGSDVVSTT